MYGFLRTPIACCWTYSKHVCLQLNPFLDTQVSLAPTHVSPLVILLNFWVNFCSNPTCARHSSWLPNQMISLVLLFGFLCRSSSWWPWPHIGGGRLFWPLLRPQMALLGHFFCKIYFLWVWRRKAFFGGSCRSLFLSLGRYFVGPLNG